MRSDAPQGSLSGPVAAERVLTRSEAMDRLTRPGVSVELSVRERRGHPERVFIAGAQTLAALFEESASDETFRVYEDERLTLAEAWRQACALGDATRHPRRFRLTRGATRPNAAQLASGPKSI